MRKALLLGVLGMTLAGGLAMAQGGREALYRPFPLPEAGAGAGPFAAWPAPAGVAATLPRPIPGIGRPLSPQEINGWDVDVRGDGQGLPPGRGTAKDGEDLYVQHCAACHGDFGEGLERWPALIGGRGSLATDQPRRTIGSYWPYAPAVFDYIRRAMPYPAPMSLSNDEYYAITAYVLHLNELLPADAELDAEKLRAIRMPNRDGFVLEARPDTPDDACMSNCRQGRPVTITIDSRQFVQPGSGSGFAEPQ
jgi:cytochrome c